MFVFNRNKLQTVLNNLCKVASTKTTIPACKQVKITSTPDGLLLACTDLELSLRTCVAALDGEPSEESTICVPAHVLYKVVKALPRAFKDVRLDVVKGRVLVEATLIKPEMAAEDYPQLPSPHEYDRTIFPLPEAFADSGLEVLEETPVRR